MATSNVTTLAGVLPLVLTQRRQRHGRVAVAVLAVDQRALRDEVHAADRGTAPGGQVQWRLVELVQLVQAVRLHHARQRRAQLDRVDAAVVRVPDSHKQNKIIKL